MPTCFTVASLAFTDSSILCTLPAMASPTAFANCGVGCRAEVYAVLWMDHIRTHAMQ